MGNDMHTDMLGIFNTAAHLGWVVRAREVVFSASHWASASMKDLVVVSKVVK